MPAAPSMALVGTGRLAVASVGSACLVRIVVRRTRTSVVVHLLLLLRLFICVVPADETSGARAKQAMMSGEMPGGAAHNRPFQAPCGIRRSGNRGKDKGSRRTDYD